MPKSKARKNKPPKRVLALMRSTSQRLSLRLTLGQFLQKFGAPLDRRFRRSCLLPVVNVGAIGNQDH